MHARKFALIIHVEDAGLVALGYTGRFCTPCEFIIAHQEELETEFLASPSIAGGLLYLLDEKGVLFVFQARRERSPVIRSELGEECQASPAFGPGRLYVRGKDHLFAFGGAAN